MACEHYAKSTKINHGMVRATTPSPILAMPVLSLQFFQLPLPYVYPSVKSLYRNWISKKNNWWKFGAFCPHCCILFMKSKFCSALSSNECISQRIAGESFCIISEIVVKCQRFFRCDSNNRKIRWVLPKLELGMPNFTNSVVLFLWQNHTSQNELDLTIRINIPRKTPSPEMKTNTDVSLLIETRPNWAR